MRIGLIAPPWVPVPPPAYGGTEVVLDNLARGLSRRGYDVQLFTLGDSTCPIDRRHLYQHAAAPLGSGAHEAAHALAAYKALADVDIIHDHTLLGPLIATQNGLCRVPIVVTNHGPFNTESRAIFTQLAGRVHIVAISHAHARSAGSIPISAVIHHGVDLDAYAIGPGAGGYLVFIGRMSPDKGVHRAMRVARRAGWPLRIVTKMREPDEYAYFEQRVAPLLGPNDPTPVEQPLAERIRLLQSADALLNPISWPEPFGLVMAEALASGVPVLAFSSGAAPEIVDHGRTGFLCKGESDMVRATRLIGQIRRRDCRAAAEQRFSLERMADDHIALYERVLGERRRGAARAVSLPASRAANRIAG